MYILLTYLCSCCCCCYFVSFVVLFDFGSSHLCCLSSQLKVVRWGRFARAEAQRREQNNIQSRFKIKKCGKRNTQNTNSISIHNLCVFFGGHSSVSRRNWDLKWVVCLWQLSDLSWTLHTTRRDDHLERFLWGSPNLQHTNGIVHGWRRCVLVLIAYTTI